MGMTTKLMEENQNMVDLGHGIKGEIKVMRK
jgi:hypothetical protein